MLNPEFEFCFRLLMWIWVIEIEIEIDSPKFSEKEYGDGNDWHLYNYDRHL